MKFIDKIEHYIRTRIVIIVLCKNGNLNYPLFLSSLVTFLSGR